LSGRNASPHGTSIPVATVDATVSFSEPCAVLAPEPVGAELELVADDPESAPPKHPATKASAVTTTAVRAPRPTIVLTTPSPRSDACLQTSG
jgi:hypothetical protein